MVQIAVSNGWRYKDRQLLESAVDTLEDIFVVFDLVGNLLRWNPSAVKITGYEPDEVARMNISEFISADEFELVATTIEKGIREGYASVEFGLICKDGHTIPFEFYGTPVHDDGGATVAVTAIGRNITERLELLEKEKEVAAASAESAAARRHSEELRDLIAVAAHELRHPATIFKGYANLLLSRRHMFDTGALDEALQAIDISADRLTHLVEELCEAALVENVAAGFDTETILPALVVTGAMNKVRPWCPEGITIVFLQPDGDQRELQAHYVHIQEALAAFLENALKFSPEPSEVRVWFEQDATGTTFFVADEGPGVPPEDRQRIFERFYQVEDVWHHSKPGLGLGLYLAKNIVEAHGGTVGMEPGVRGGSLFYFTIPFVQARRRHLDKE